VHQKNGQHNKKKAEVSEPLRPVLLEELLRVEIELRRRAGEEPTEEEYHMPANTGDFRVSCDDLVYCVFAHWP